MKKLTVGLLGGSFNPPHLGHVHISNEALKKIGLDKVWWLVAKQNPLKISHDYSNFDHRMKQAKNIVERYKRSIEVINTEKTLRYSYSYNIVTLLQKKFKNINFIWLMGSDSLIVLHKWYRWKDFCQLLPIAVFERRDYVYNSLKSPFAYYFHSAYYTNSRSLLTIDHGWSFIRTKIYPISSSEIRVDNRNSTHLHWQQ